MPPHDLCVIVWHNPITHGILFFTSDDFPYCSEWNFLFLFRKEQIIHVFCVNGNIWHNFGAKMKWWWIQKCVQETSIGQGKGLSLPTVYRVSISHLLIGCYILRRSSMIAQHLNEFNFLLRPHPPLKWLNPFYDHFRKIEDLSHFQTKVI